MAAAAVVEPGALMAMPWATGRVVGRTVVVPAPTPCKLGPSPVWKLPLPEPVVGQVVDLQWTITGVPELVTAIVALKAFEEPVDLSPVGLLGCWLLVEPMYWVVGNEYVEGQPNLAWHPESSTGSVWWTCSEELSVFSWHFQVVVQDARGLRGGDAVVVRFGRP